MVQQIPKDRADEEHLVEDMIELGQQNDRYGYRHIAALLLEGGSMTNVLNTCGDVRG